MPKDQSRSDDLAQRDQFLIVMGNPVDGFSFIGPFDDPADAALHGEKYLDDEEFWVASMCAPQEPLPN